MIQFERVLKRNIKKNQRATFMAFIVKGGSLISAGINNYRRLSYKYKHKNGYTPRKGLHAELAAILNCKPQDKLKGATIIVAGITRSGKPLISTKPCKYCMNAIQHVGISKVIYYESGNQKIIKVKELESCWSTLHTKDY